MALEENSADDLDRLAALLRRERETVLVAWRAKVRELPSARNLDTPRLDDHMPKLVDELSKLFDTHARESIMDALRASSPPQHGLQRVAQGFELEEVVAEYNVLRGCVHDLADRHGIRLQGRPFHILNEMFDCAIGLAVQTFATEQALEIQRRREEYLAFVMHDLRTPLNAISLAAGGLDSSLSRSHEPSDPESRLLRALRRNVQHLSALIARVIEENENLQTEVGVRLERREFDLWPFVELLIHDLHPVAGTASTELLNDVPEDLVVYADANLLRRVFQNLIANAIRHTPRGTVTIGARYLDEPRREVECWVRDDGAGIAARLRERIFDKEEQDLAQGGNPGLGLVIVKTFVEAHGGTVSVESSEGRGSRFVVTLPGKP